MKPQLPKTITNAEPYLLSGEWGMQEKKDGERLVLEVTVDDRGNHKRAYNRNGVEREVPAILLPIQFKSNVTLDGEITKDKYWVFDIDMPEFTLEYRHAFLRSSYKLWSIEQYHLIDWLPMYEYQKWERFQFLKTHGAEGVVFKKMNSKMHGGKSNNWLKYKFLNQIDCFVMDVGTDVANLTLGVYNNGEPVEVGHSSSLTADGPKCKVGDVVTITFAKITDSNRLFHPVMPTLRTDKAAEECTIDQLLELKG